MGHSARTIHIEDDDYPAALCRARNPPSVLHVDGDLGGLERAVGIVGTRRATAEALDVTRALARTLAAAGVPIVSGGAEGIDAAAHEGALDADDGRTIAVLPTALSRPFPRAHARLFERIAARGARITEHADGSGTYPAHFLERNRLIAALSAALVVVQAPHDSGALRTAHDAIALGIPVLATPWSPRERAATGGLALLAGGARICRDARDVLVALGEDPGPARKPTARTRQLTLPDPDQAALLALLGETAIDRETLLTRARLPASRGQAALLHLVLEGHAHEDAHGIRRRSR